MNPADFGIDLEEAKRVLAEYPDPFSPEHQAVQRKIVAALQAHPEQAELIFANFKRRSPENHDQLVRVLTTPSTVLELMGYESWLRKLGPHTFTRPFAPIQRRFWEWNWTGLMKRKRGELLLPKEKVGFLPWSRETGKSSTVEWATISDGAVLSQGFVIYLCGQQFLAEKHVIDIRDRIESEEVARYYPHLGKPKLGAHGNRYGWGKDFLMTKGGWAIRPIGLDVAARGGKSGNIRPTLIVIDDIDELGDSIDVILSNEQKLTRSILAMGDANTRVLVAQNPIHSMSIINRLLTGICSALAVRTIFGGGPSGREPVKAIEDLEVEHTQQDGGPRHLIRSGRSNWPGITPEMWQDSLDRVGYEGFMAEYQHDFSAELEERVLPPYDDRITRVHVITWSQFCRLYFGDSDAVRMVPDGWTCAMGTDFGFTKGHLSAWTWLTRAPSYAPLAGSVFRYRGRTFRQKMLDDQVTAIKAAMWPGELERIKQQSCSHEKLGERLTLNQKFGFSFQPCDKDKWSGIPEWIHLLYADKSQPHPFHEDTRNEDGLWKLGRPAWFDIVADGQLESPRDDDGLKTHRDEAFNWKKRKVKLTETGLTAEQPMKVDDDTGDATRQLIRKLAPIVPLTAEQKVQRQLPVHVPEILARTDLDPAQRQLSVLFIENEAKQMLERLKPPETDQFGQPLGKWR